VTAGVGRLTEVWSHRGRVTFGDEAQENTVAAFLKASEAEVAGIELDVWLTSDGAWVVHHDRRCAVGDLDRLRRAEVPETVPELSSALAACSVGTVNVELKVPPLAGRSEARRLGRELAAYLSPEGPMAEKARRLVISSFSRDAVDAALGAGVPTGLLLETLPSHADLASLAREGYWAAHVEHIHLGPREVATSHEAGLRVVAWTVDREDDIARLVRQGVDVLISNLPVQAAAVARGP